MKNALLITLLALTACGGGSSSSTPASAPEPTQPQSVRPGLYGVSIDEGAGAFNGEIATDSDGSFLYASGHELGFGTWFAGSGRVTATMTRLSRPIDDLGNEFPSAKASGLERALNLEISGSNDSTWSGGGVTLSPDSAASAPSLAGIPRNWRYANLFRFDGQFVDYTAQIDIDSAGVLTGFDTHGCTFSGELEPRTDSVPLYRAHIVAAGCGATSQFIENAEYTGYAYISLGVSAGEMSLVINVVNRSQQGGLGVLLKLDAVREG